MFNLVLFGLKIVFLVLLYIFLLFVVMGALRDIPSKTESERESRGRVRARLIVHGAGDQQQYSLHDNFTIGRAPDNDFVIDDTFASQHHAKILATGDGFVLQDLESTNGTFLEGARVSELMTLHDGATVTIGKAALIYQEE